MECSMCKKDVTRLTYGDKCSTGACRGCYHGSGIDLSLNGVIWTDGKTRLTKGKAWEIDNRTVSRDDGRTVVNRKTGKPAQY